jgi:hypothetical protein
VVSGQPLADLQIGYVGKCLSEVENLATQGDELVHLAVEGAQPCAALSRKSPTDTALVHRAGYDVRFFRRHGLVVEGYAAGAEVRGMREFRQRQRKRLGHWLGRYLRRGFAKACQGAPLRLWRCNMAAKLRE